MHHDGIIQDHRVRRGRVEQHHALGIPDFRQSLGRGGQRLTNVEDRTVGGPGNRPGPCDGIAREHICRRIVQLAEPRHGSLRRRLVRQRQRGEEESILHGVEVVHDQFVRSAVRSGALRPDLELAIHVAGFMGAVPVARTPPVGVGIPRVGQEVERMRPFHQRASRHGVGKVRIDDVGRHHLVELQVGAPARVGIVVLHQHKWRRAVGSGVEIAAQRIGHIAAIASLNERMFFVGIIARLGLVVLHIDKRCGFGHQHA